MIEATVYTSINLQETPENIAKFSSHLESEILKKISGESLEKFIHEGSEPIYVHRIVRYFVKALSFIPLFIAADGTQGKSDDYKKFCFLESERVVIIAILNSSLFYWFWRTHSDGFHCGFNDVYLMPYNRRIEPEIRANLSSLSKDLIKAWKASSSIKKISTQKGEIQYQEFSPKSAKPIIDEIDRVLAQHYGFTDEELDFIINYDIKYRMGRDSES